MTKTRTYLRTASFDHGKYRLRHLLRGGEQDGLWLDDQASPPAWITHRRLRHDPRLDQQVSYSVAGITTLRFIGAPDPDRATRSDEYTAFVEDAPIGVPLSQTGNLNEEETAVLGTALCDLIVRWAAACGGSVISGLRPETIFLVGMPGERRFSVAAPRSYYLLSDMGRYGHELVPYVDPPTLASFYSLQDGLFVVALNLWIAHTGIHPYQLPGDTIENHMSNDRRSTFPFASRLGTLLERVLVADAAKRPSIDEFREELSRLAR